MEMEKVVREKGRCDICIRPFVPGTKGYDVTSEPVIIHTCEECGGYIVSMLWEVIAAMVRVKGVKYKPLSGGKL